VRCTIEKALRFFDVNGDFALRRHLTEDVEIGGEVLPHGTTVVCAMAAANRNETAFENPAERDLARSPNPHLAFGPGTHSCLGQALARTELQVHAAAADADFVAVADDHPVAPGTALGAYDGDSWRATLTCPSTAVTAAVRSSSRPPTGLHILSEFPVPPVRGAELPPAQPGSRGNRPLPNRS